MATNAKGALAHVQVKYDTFVTVYMSDCDFYPRVRAAGFETLNYPEVSQPPLCPHKLIGVLFNQPSHSFLAYTPQAWF